MHRPHVTSARVARHYHHVARAGHAPAVSPIIGPDMTGPMNADDLAESEVRLVELVFPHRRAIPVRHEEAPGR
jgi:hypothetical protein